MHIVGFLIGSAFGIAAALCAAFMLFELATRTPVLKWVALPFDLLLNLISWRPSADVSIALDGATRGRFSMSSMRLPGWHAFKAFIERARNHRESFGDGYQPEYAG
jgi:hypothetical protein